MKPKYLKNKARIRLESGQEPRKVVLYYALIAAGMTLAVNLVQYFVSDQMSQAGGLRNIGTRSMLGTISNILPIVQFVVMMCITLGYTAAMLRISRRQFASPKTLKAGVERFWVLLRTRLLMMLLYIAIGFALSYAAVAIFMMTPLSNRFTELLMPLVSSSGFTIDSLLSDAAMMARLSDALLPMMVIYLLLLLPMYLVISYLYRFVDYILIDVPGCRAREAMRRSRALTQGNRLNLFKLDLSFWWYYLLRVLAMMLAYVDMILILFGIRLPFFATIAIYLAADAAVTILFQNRVEVAFALAYDSLLPKEKQEGIVLGNIFEM